MPVSAHFNWHSLHWLTTEPNNIPIMHCSTYLHYRRVVVSITTNVNYFTGLLYYFRYTPVPRYSTFPRCKTAARTRNKSCISSSVYVSTFIADRMFANSTASSRPSHSTLPPYRHSDHCHWCTRTLTDKWYSEKMAEPIVTQFELWTWVGPRKHVLGGGGTLTPPGKCHWTVHVW